MATTIVYRRDSPITKCGHIFYDLSFSLQVEKINDNNSMVYFLNVNEEIIPIPEGVSCVNVTSNVLEDPLTINEIESFLISRCDSYDFYIEEKRFFSIYSSVTFNHTAIVYER